ncbi:hypothetical protein ACFFX0_29990 [Citricoccus parietis]|uniref:Uncharacterized protein n=1 Tax=Citricoccus parietis TaxID=592307 RepID=A0ABV5G8C1_9MICC
MARRPHGSPSGGARRALIHGANCEYPDSKRHRPPPPRPRIRARTGLRPPPKGRACATEFRAASDCRDRHGISHANIASR